MAYENIRDLPKLDPNKDYTIEELADYVRNALKGETVRESFARSMEKTSDVAEWSRKVAQDIIDGNFEEGELLTEIERKLNEAEENYAPRLTQVENEVSEKVNIDEYEQRTENLNQKIEKTIPDNGFDLPHPWYFAHRGAMNLYQENTMIAYENCIRRGNKFLELDVQQTRDGALVIMHDTTGGRTTETSWRMNEVTSNYLSTKKVTDKVQSGYYGYLNQPIPFLSDVLTRFDRKANYIIESKDRNSSKEIAKMVKEMKLEDYTMIQSFSLDDLKEIKDEGIKLMYLSNNATSSTFEEMKENNIYYFGCGRSNSDEYIQSAINADLEIFIYTVNHRFERDKFLDIGVHGFFSDDPFYLSETGVINREDGFREKVFMDGMLSSYNNDRGKFNTESLTPYTWGFPSANPDTDGRDFVLQGWIGELSGSFTIELDLNFGEYVSGWGSIAFCTPMDYFDDNKSDLSSGYHLLITTGGNTTLYKATNGSASELKREQGNAISGPTTKKIRITVQPNNINIENITDSISYSINNSDYRGGFIHFGRRNTPVTFSNVKITEL